MCFGLEFSRIPTSHGNNYCSGINYAHVTYRVYNILYYASQILLNIWVNIHVHVYIIYHRNCKLATNFIYVVQSYCNFDKTSITIVDVGICCTL